MEDLLLPRCPSSRWWLASARLGGRPGSAPTPGWLTTVPKHQALSDYRITACSVCSSRSTLDQTLEQPVSLQSHGSVDVHINMDQSVQSEPRMRLQLAANMLRDAQALIGRLEVGLQRRTKPSHNHRLLAQRFVHTRKIAWWAWFIKDLKQHDRSVILTKY